MDKERVELCFKRLSNFHNYINTAGISLNVAKLTHESGEILDDMVEAMNEPENDAEQKQSLTPEKLSVRAQIWLDFFNRYELQTIDTRQGLADRMLKEFDQRFPEYGASEL